MTPYRLINASEMQQLQQHFNQELKTWNDTYCIIPLQAELTKPTTISARPMDAEPCEEPLIRHCVTPSPHAWGEGNNEESYLKAHPLEENLALLQGDYLKVINQALFGENKSCFNTASQNLLFLLAQRFFKTEHCILNKNSQENPNWFYAGSTCLLLTLHCHEHQFTLIINPDWIYKQLPKKIKTQKKLSSFDEALTKLPLHLNLELIPSCLSIKDLACLHIGDVFATNHPLSKPLQLTRKNHVFAQAELNQSSHYKSILLKRTP